VHWLHEHNPTIKHQGDGLCGVKGVEPRIRSASGAGELKSQGGVSGLHKGKGGGRGYPTFTLLKQLRCCSSLPNRWRYLLAMVSKQFAVSRKISKARTKPTSDFGGHRWGWCARVVQNGHNALPNNAWLYCMPRMPRDFLAFWCAGKRTEKAAQPGPTRREHHGRGTSPR
jgi:hypothetical protein